MVHRGLDVEDRLRRLLVVAVNRHTSSSSPAVYATAATARVRAMLALSVAMLALSVAMLAQSVGGDPESAVRFSTLAGHNASSRWGSRTQALPGFVVPAPVHWTGRLVRVP